MLRTNTVLLHPNKEQQKTLVLLNEASARLWNKANYQRRQAFFSHNRRPTYAFQCSCFKDDTDYKFLGTCKAQALLQKLNEAWKAAIVLFKLRRTGKRGLYCCPINHKYINEDVNGSLNIADASPNETKKELTVASSMAEPLLLRWDGGRWESKSSVIIQEGMNTLEVQTTKIPILVKTPGRGIL